MSTKERAAPTKTALNDKRQAVTQKYSTANLRGEALPAQAILADLRMAALEEERALLGATLFSGRGEAAAEAYDSGLLRDPRHQLIAEAITELYRHHIEVNLQSTANQLQGKHTLQAAGGPHYLASLTSCDHIPGMEALHALHVRSSWQRYESATRLVEELERLVFGREVLL